MNGVIGGDVKVAQIGNFTLSVVGNGTKCTYDSKSFTVKARTANCPKPTHSSEPHRSRMPAGMVGRTVARRRSRHHARWRQHLRADARWQWQFAVQPAVRGPRRFEHGFPVPDSRPAGRRSADPAAGARRRADDSHQVGAERRPRAGSPHALRTPRHVVPPPATSHRRPAYAPRREDGGPEEEPALHRRSERHERDDAQRRDRTARHPETEPTGPRTRATRPRDAEAGIRPAGCTRAAVAAADRRLGQTGTTPGAAASWGCPRPIVVPMNNRTHGRVDGACLGGSLRYETGYIDARVRLWRLPCR